MSAVLGLFEKSKRSIFNLDQERRTSHLHAPKERIEDHKGEVLTCDLDPSGELILTAGRDCLIHMCRVYSEEGSVMVMTGHTGPVMQAKFFNDGKHFYTCSGDKTMSIWDTYCGKRIDKFLGHKEYVNCVHSTKECSNLCSGSDDGTVRIWDVRTNICCAMLETGYRVFATCYTNSGERVICAGANKGIHVWDIRMNAVVCRLQGHSAPVTGIALSPCGSFLLSHALDSTLRTWHILPSAPNNRWINIFPSNQDFVQRNLLRCAWSPMGCKIAAGCANPEEVNIWDLKTRKLFCKLPGHNDSVNDIAFHPFEPIVVTASTDKCVYLTETEH